MITEYVVDPDSGCWIWQRSLSRDGYGRVSRQGYWLAHRWYYEQLIGPIPEGLQIDHLCRNRACVNPAHLEPVTPRENTWRGEAVTVQKARFPQTHCKHGHEFNDENTYEYEGHRCCRACNRERKRGAARAPEAPLVTVDRGIYRRGPTFFQVKVGGRENRQTASFNTLADAQAWRDAMEAGVS